MRGNRQSGMGAILMVAILAVVFGVATLALMTESQQKQVAARRGVQLNGLRQNGVNAIRLYDQYLHAGFLKANCAANSLMPTSAAPAHLVSRFNGNALTLPSCDQKKLKPGNTAGLFAAKGRVPSSAACGAVPSTVTVQRADWANRTVELRARTGAAKGAPLDADVLAKIKLPPPPVPSFGLLVNDLHCGMCHVKVNGDVVSTKPVTTFHYGKDIVWKAAVEGAWLAAASWHPELPSPPPADAGAAAIQIAVRDGVQQNLGYKNPLLPGKYSPGTSNYNVQFPAVNFAALAAIKQPDPYSCTPRPLKTLAGNQVMIGKDQAHPIVLDGDVHVTGDLVIKGWYTGVGTLYVDGNIYVPFDIRAVRSIFPYDADPATADKQARASVEGRLHDGLALATRRNIIIGRYDYQGFPLDPPGTYAADPAVDLAMRTRVWKNHSVWYHQLTPADKQGDLLNVKSVEAWFPGGLNGYRGLFEQAFNCLTGDPNEHLFTMRSLPDGTTQKVTDLGLATLGSVNMIEAYLYAQNTIGGLARRNSYSINGGVIADNYHVVSGAPSCKDKTDVHPVHKQSVAWSYINYDRRMKFGLPLLDRFSEFFVANPD